MLPAARHVSERTLSLDEARAFYDAFGARQDGQAFYEDAATSVLPLCVT